MAEGIEVVGLLVMGTDSQTGVPVRIEMAEALLVLERIEKPRASWTLEHGPVGSDWEYHVRAVPTDKDRSFTVTQHRHRGIGQSAAASLTKALLARLTKEVRA